MTNINKSESIALKIGDIINGHDIDDVKLALMSIWYLIHEIEKKEMK